MEKLEINKHLLKYLPSDNSKLSRAMRYSVMAGGKRLRPILCIEAAKLFDANLSQIIPAACAIEMIHTFTLIHDDLPAMDNSDLRRGKLTCHKKFGEDIAILAGDALNTLAFYVISKYCPLKKSALVIEELSQALLNVVDGQAIDIGSSGKKISLIRLRKMHSLKTSALIEASLKIGAILAGANNKNMKSLESYGRHIGLAFQIADDILDAESVSLVLGKPAKLDLANKKSTYVSLLGIQKAKEAALEEYEQALKCLAPFGQKAKCLMEIAEFVVRRKK